LVEKLLGKLEISFTFLKFFSDLFYGLKLFTFPDINTENPATYYQQILKKQQRRLPHINCLVFQSTRRRFQQLHVEPLGH
jgi:hypothetical protein